jgi:tRNA-splicing ligase RtcB (3'-phosphate/5'-hydroxy nucleic acid ligase)
MHFEGKYATCEVMIEEIDESARQQIKTFLDCPAFANARIRIMPDVHAGIGSVIGFTATLGARVIPNVVGVDIGCGIASHCLGRLPWSDFFEPLDRHIRANVPSGFDIRDACPLWPDTESDLIDAVVKVAGETGQDEKRVLRSLGTLGGGNHFIELGKDDGKRVWLTIHTGSRNFGLRIANHHQALAGDKGNPLACLEIAESARYCEHMRIAQRYAQLNRRIIALHILDFFREHHGVEGVSETVESIHNYIDFDDRMIRKGAIAAHRGQRVVIPWNMRDGLVIGTGKGNHDWNFSAPHGAGRVMSRGQARKKLDVGEFEKSMNGVWSSCVGKATLDEAPMVYKDAVTIRQAIGDTVDVEMTVKPLYNFKGCGD